MAWFHHLKFKIMGQNFVKTMNKLQENPVFAQKVNELSQWIKKCSNICLILKQTTHKNNIIFKQKELSSKYKTFNPSTHKNNSSIEYSF